MREKQKSCFKNYVLLVGKDFFLILIFFIFYLFFFLHKHYYIGAKLILAILMLISRKPVQRGGIGEKCVFFVLLRTGHRKRVRLPNVGSCCVSLHVAFRWCYTELFATTILLRHCFEWFQHCSNIATLCCAKNRGCESSRVTSPSSNDDVGGNENGRKAIALNWQHNNVAHAAGFFWKFLCHHCRTSTWNFLMSPFMKDVKTKQL